MENSWVASAWDRVHSSVIFMSKSFVQGVYDKKRDTRPCSGCGLVLSWKLFVAHEGRLLCKHCVKVRVSCQICIFSLYPWGEYFCVRDLISYFLNDTIVTEVKAVLWCLQENLASF